MTSHPTDAGHPNPLGSATTPLLFVVSGPSGVGKDSVLDQVKALHPEYHYAVTVTTRAMRTGEREGASYHFRSREDFQRMLAEGELLEWATVYDNFYGTPKFELRRAAAEGRDIVVKVDIQGAASIRALVPQAILVFIAPQSPQELTDRLATRSTETPEQLASRTEAVRRELEAMHSFDYVVVNRHGALGQAVADTVAILRAEKLRAAPRVFTLS